MGQTKRRTARTTIVRIAGCCRDGSAGVARTCSAASYHGPSGTGWALNGTCAYSRFRFRRGLVGGRVRSTRPVWHCDPHAYRNSKHQRGVATSRTGASKPSPKLFSILTALDDFAHPSPCSHRTTFFFVLRRTTAHCNSGELYCALVRRFAIVETAPYFAEHVQAEAGSFLILCAWF